MSVKCIADTEENQLSLRIVHLENSQGRGLTVTLRGFRLGDEEGMIACVRDEYGESYHKKGFYSAEYLRQEAKKGFITFLVAQTKAGEIAGMLILHEFFPEESMCKIASEIIRKKYRRYGLAMPFFEYGMDILLHRNVSAASCLPVAFHDITQRLLYRLGMRATGLILNVFDLEQLHHSYKNGRNTKHSLGIQIRAVNKWNVGKVYLPKEHQDFCLRIYEGLDVMCCIAKESRMFQKGRTVSTLSYRQDELHHSLEIRIYGIGIDLPERIDALHKEYPLKGKQTANIFLNINDPNAVWAYQKLKQMGYFFTGIKPLCSENEYMVLHHLGEVEVYFQDYVMSEEFAEILKYVEKQCKKSQEKD